jgi:VWFA-related protein
VIEESDVSLLRSTLLTRISARGKTALYDAINGALDRLRSAKHTRQVLVIVSDGSDNASSATLEDTLARIQGSNAMIYSVALQDPVDRDGNPKLLRRISTDTGGEAFMPRRIEEVPEALEHIARDIRATYTIGYVPKNQQRDGKMRKLRVVASHPDGRKLKVQTRGGYMAPAAPTSRSGGAGGR